MRRWALCDSCGKWRFISDDVLLGAQFLCRDLAHASCEAEEEKAEEGKGNVVVEMISDRAEMFGSELGNGAHRYRLTRQWDTTLKEVVFVMPP